MTVLRHTLLRHAGAAIVAAGVIWALSVRLNDFRDFQMANIAVYVVAVAGLTVLIGLSGQISLGHGAFMAVGAYAAAHPGLVFEDKGQNLALHFRLAPQLADQVSALMEEVADAADRLGGLPLLAQDSHQLALRDSWCSYMFH